MHFLPSILSAPGAERRGYESFAARGRESYNKREGRGSQSVCGGGSSASLLRLAELLEEALVVEDVALVVGRTSVVRVERGGARHVLLEERDRRRWERQPCEVEVRDERLRAGRVTQ